MSEFKVVYWDEVSKSQKERDMTPAERAQRDIDIADAVAHVPQVVSMRAARRVLYAVGLLDTVEDAIADMPGADGDLARIDWNTALTVNRTDPVVAQLIPALGKTGAEIDAMFVAAAALD